jgi:hypothetical protein
MNEKNEIPLHCPTVMNKNNFHKEHESKKNKATSNLQRKQL